MRTSDIVVRKLPLSECGRVGEVAVVVDVLRAFSTEAYAFAAGANEIQVVRTVEEAFALKAQDPNLLLMGEVDGYRVPGFDLWNSPGDLQTQEIAGKRLVHRTSAGTQGIIGCAGARRILASSFVCASATARQLRALPGLHQVDFIITGQGERRDGDEDAACADYIAALLIGHEPDPAPFIQRVFDSDAGQRFFRELPAEEWLKDFELCTRVDTFDFSLQVFQDQGKFIIRKGL